MKNVIYDDGKELNPGTLDYTYTVLTHLKKLLPNFNDYLFIVYNHLGTTLPASRNFKHDKKILFWEAGTYRRQPFDEIKDDYLSIFSTHAKSRHKVVHSIPLGYWDSKVDGRIIEMPERMYDISFTGCLNRNRVHLASLLSGRSKEWIALGLLKRQKKTLEIINRIVQWRYTNDYFMFTEDFGAGLDKEKYTYILRNSKVILSPRGWISTECFRMYEAMKMGCAVITETLPDREYYKNIPVIQIDKWKDGLKIARELLKDKDKLEKIGKKNLEFYKNNFHPRAVAKNISLVIRGLQKN